MATKATLPEFSVNVGDIVVAAKAASDARAKVAEYETVEKLEKEKVSLASVILREEQEAIGNYIGKIVVTGKDFPPIRTEFRMSGGALETTQEQDLDAIFGPARPLLFGRAIAVSKITDPAALIAQLTSEGKNPWDYLSLSVREGMDSVIAKAPGVIAHEALLPQEGFLNTLNEIKVTLSERAKSFLRDFLKEALKPMVVMGTKNKK